MSVIFSCLYIGDCLLVGSTVVGVLPIFVAVFSFLFDSYGRAGRHLRCTLTFTNSGHSRLRGILACCGSSSLGLGTYYFLVRGVPQCFDCAKRMLSDVGTVGTDISGRNGLPSRGISPLGNFACGRLPGVCSTRIVATSCLVRGVRLTFRR